MDQSRVGGAFFPMPRELEDNFKNPKLVAVLGQDLCLFGRPSR